jgi:catechol 2,3-dioxygenase-like lactoylglutathione lyase family enzyme
VTLHHVALPTLVEDVDAEVAFWTLLGYSVVAPPSSLGARATWLEAPDGTQIHLLYASPGEPTARAGHLAVVAPSPFEATLTALEASGHSVEPRTPHWGAPRAYVHTPGGHLVELVAWPPPPARPGP